MNLKAFSRGESESPKVLKVTLLVTIKVRLLKGFLNTVPWAKGWPFSSATI